MSSLKFYYRDLDTGITYDMTSKSDGDFPLIAKLPPNIPLVKGDIFSFLNTNCPSSSEDCSNEIQNQITSIVTNPTNISILNNTGMVIEKVPPVLSPKMDICSAKSGCNKLDMQNGKLPSVVQKL